MKTIGLIGGMSWESSAHYYRILNEETARLLGGLHSCPVIMHSVDFAPIAQMQAAGDWDRAGRELNTVARGLVSAGAEVLGIATNTMHVIADAITQSLDVPLLHIADPTAETLLADGFDTVGLLGTSFTMEMPFYKDRLMARGLTPLVPEVDRTNLHGIIYEELCKGIVRDESRQVYVTAIERLKARGAQAVILGCTEIGMLIDDSVSPLPTYDTTDLHAKALVAAALS
ncbi:aspartate/glutamate racemase family protein [Devosia rhizoryzae]|uniref:Aspartate/glutamate racemase family protein n=1 Tax=Devosia rhizoryzae TaxID=2774137 RepID=A0ABX7C4T7_9HYPH|nr:aspartate/glutamate racemase family protein [Devosia rhizoryzae]QQR39240.1 aspartate/glutamate racemase family protein [Devosia rhizoryzae]